VRHFFVAFEELMLYIRNASVAQRIEHLTSDQSVAGSIPVGGTRIGLLAQLVRASDS
jgi:hypothetical protein